MWKRGREISADGEPITVWNKDTWKNGGSFELAGQGYRVGADMWGCKYGMSTADGAEVARADRVGRKHWTIVADGVEYSFERASLWRGDQVLLDKAGAEVGRVRRTDVWRGDAEADLPGLPLPVQLFAFVVVISMWEAAQIAAAASAG